MGNPNYIKKGYIFGYAIRMLGYIAMGIPIAYYCPGPFSFGRTMAFLGCIMAVDLGSQIQEQFKP